MKRRDAFKMVPLTLAGIGGLARHAAAIESAPRTIPLDDPLPLALHYPQVILNMLDWVQQNQSENILESAYAISRTLRKGGKFWINWDQGHSTRGEMFDGRDGMPEFLTHGYDPAKAKDGDILMASRILSAAGYADLEKKDVFVIGAPSPWSGDGIGFGDVRDDIQKLKTSEYSDIWIETNMTSTGPILRIPGMPSPIGPVSGPLYLTIMWMIMSDVCRVHSIEGESYKVMGDEPELKKSDRTTGLRDPLMDNYLDSVRREIGLIGAELGDIRKIAKMATDTLLNDGTVYYYSKYPETFMGEATGRRGGFAFARGLSDGKIEGTSKDCCIMGVFTPNDEADLKNLDKIRKIGMPVASIGPIMKNFVEPEGRCVHKETDIHVGRTSDTYGLYALPGGNRKVCPTSGITMIVNHWAISLEIVEQIRERTGGNVPGAHYSGALKWGSDFNRRTRAMQKNRGY